MHSKLMQTMSHVPFTWAKRISLAEDAQNQRHRGTVGLPPGAPGLEQPRAGRDRALGHPPEPGRARRVQRDDPALTDARNALLDRGVRAGGGASTCCRTRSGSASTRAAPCSTTTGSGSSASATTRSGRSSKPRSTKSPRCGKCCRRSDVMSMVRPASCAPAPATTPICPEGERFCGIPVWRNYRFDELESRRVM